MQIGVDSARAVENKRVFVVDSDDIIATALQFMLADEMETHIHDSLDAALAAAVHTPPLLILLGESVLIGEGVGVVSRFKEAIKDVRILVICMDAEADVVRQAVALGANGSLVRPLKIEMVRRRVDTQLGRRATLSIPVVRVGAP